MNYRNCILTMLLQGVIALLPIGAQVSLVKDITQGGEGTFTPSSTAGIAFGDRLIFPANSAENGIELWISDGSEGGTYMLKDINPGIGDSDPHSFFLAFEKIYFNAFTADEGRELWVTDGTAQGTQLVMDIEVGSEGSDPSPGDIYKGFLYFAATANGDREVWRLDSLTAPELFINLNPTAQSRPREFKSANGMLYFSANYNAVDAPEIDQDEPYVTDGTPEGTLHLELYIENPEGAEISDFTPLEEFVFFLGSPTGGSNPSDILIWETQGDLFSTGPTVSDLITPVYWLMPVKGKINFMVQDFLYQLEVLSSAKVVEGIELLSNPLRRGDPKPNAYINGNLCLPAQHRDDNIGVELYMSDGDDTWLTTDIFPGSGSSDPWHIVSTGTKALFAASSSETNRELYESDGTLDGTKLVSDLFPGEEGSNPTNLVIAGKNVFFYATTPETGYELYKYDLEPSSVNHNPHVFGFEGKVYPQPAYNGQTITVEWLNNEMWISAELVDQNGTVHKLYQIEGESRVDIDIKSIPSGVYLLNLTGKQGQSTCKVIIQ